MDTLAAATSEEPETLEDVYEPYLIQLGMLARTPGDGGHAPGPAPPGTESDINPGQEKLW